MTADRNHTTSTTDVNGNTTSYTYDGYSGQVVSTTTPGGSASSDGIVTNNSYTETNGRLAQTYQSGTAAISYNYANGALSGMVRKTFRNGNAQWQKYSFDTNAWGQNTAIKVSSSTNGSTYSSPLTLASYVYEPRGGNLTKMFYGENTETNTKRIEYSYDSLDRLKKTTYTDTNETVEYSYNADGALSRLTHKKGSNVVAIYEFEYDSLGRLLRSIQYNGSGEVVQRTGQIYGKYGRLDSQQWVLGNTPYSEEYTYNDSADGQASDSVDGSLTQMTTAIGAKLNFTYDGLKRLQKTELKSGNNVLLETRYAFAPVSGNRTSAQVEYHKVLQGGTTNVITGAKYTYDNRGNIVTIQESVSPYRTLASYTYDSQNQLTEEKQYTYSGSSTTPTTTNTYAYTYDTAGNILTEKLNGSTQKTYTYGNPQWVDKLTSIKVGSTTKAISYDGSGNPTTWVNNIMPNASLVWERGRQLSYVGYDDGHAIYQVAYEYDANGIRTEKYDDDILHTYLTQNGKVMRETIGTGSTAKVLDFIYDNQGRPLALKYSTNGGSSFNTYYYVLNYQGDVVKLIHYIPGFEYSEVASYTYDAWGNVLSSSGTLASVNPLRYRGYYYDTETGFYYLQSRYYDPIVRRFLNADSYASTGQGFLGTNMFAYCNNNPIIYADPQGHSIIGIIGVIGLIVGTTLAATACSAEEREWPSDCPYYYWGSGATSTDANCYTYAFDYGSVSDPGGFADNRFYSDNLFNENDRVNIGILRDAVIADAAARERDVTYIESPDQLCKGEYLVVCKLSEDRTTYHFAVMLPNGVWVDKPGSSESRYGKINGFDEIWEVNGLKYTSEPLFFSYKRD